MAIHSIKKARNNNYIINVEDSTCSRIIPYLKDNFDSMGLAVKLGTLNSLMKGYSFEVQNDGQGANVYLRDEKNISVIIGSLHYDPKKKIVTVAYCEMLKTFDNSPFRQLRLYSSKPENTDLGEIVSWALEN